MGKKPGRWHTVMVLISLLLLFSLIACSGATPTAAPQATATLTPTVTATPGLVPVAQPMKLRVASPTAPPPATVAMGVMKFEEIVTQATGGKITFENTWAGSLVAPGEVLDAVQNKVVDIVHGIAVYVPGKLPLRNFEFAFAFRPSDSRVMLEIMREMTSTIPAFEEEMATYNIKEFYIQGGLSYDIISTSPVKTLDDMKGKKMAVVGTEFPRWVAASGAVPVSMPAGDRYVAMQRGTIDGEVLVMDWIGDLKHYEVAKHYTYTDLGSIMAIGMWINLDMWDSFAPELQKLFLDAAREAEDYHVNLLQERRADYIKAFEESGVNFYTMSEQDKARWAELMPDIPAEWAAQMQEKGLPGWEIVDTFISLANKKGHEWPRQWGQR